LGTASNQFGKLHSTSGVEISRTDGSVSDVDIAFANVNNHGFYAVAANSIEVVSGGQNTVSFKDDRGILMKVGSIAVYKDDDTTSKSTAANAYIDESSTGDGDFDTLVMRMSRGNMGAVTLEDPITAVKFFRVPGNTNAVTFTLQITQASGGGKTIDYTASAVDVYSNEGTSGVTGEIFWAGGVPHTMTTTANAVDIVQFTCIPTGSTYNIFASVIGQGFAVAT